MDRPSGSTLRLQQLLAEQRLPAAGVAPSGHHPVAHTARAQVQAAVEPPPGSFHWRYSNTPHQLKALWATGQANTIVRGAVMKFENEQRNDRRRGRRGGRVAAADR